MQARLEPQKVSPAAYQAMLGLELLDGLGDAGAQSLGIGFSVDHFGGHGFSS